MNTATEFRRITPEEVVSALKAIDAVPIRGTFYAPPGVYDEKRPCTCGLGAVLIAERRKKGKDELESFRNIFADLVAIELNLTVDYLQSFTRAFDAGWDAEDIAEVSEDYEVGPCKSGFIDGATSALAVQSEFPAFIAANEEDDDE